MSRTNARELARTVGKRIRAEYSMSHGLPSGIRGALAQLSSIEQSAGPPAESGVCTPEPVIVEAEPAEAEPVRERVRSR